MRAHGSLGRIAIIAFCVAALGAVQFFRLPDALAGAGLGVLDGSRTDPHELTRSAWLLVARHYEFSASCVHAWNFAVFALLDVAIVFMLWLAGVDTAVAACSGAVLAISPLTVALVVEPLGGEDAVGLAIFALAAVTFSGRLELPRLVRIILPALLLLQAPLDGLVALYCVALEIRRSALDGMASLAAVVLAAGLHSILHSWPIRSAAIDPLAGPATIVAIGIVVFGITPLALYAAKTGFFNRLSLDVQSVSGLLMTGLLALVGGLFANGDPSVQWFGLEICVVLAVACSVRYTSLRPGWGALALIVILGLLSGSMTRMARAASPALHAASQLQFVTQVLGRDVKGSICLVHAGKQWRQLVDLQSFAAIYEPHAILHNVRSSGECLAPASHSDAILAEDNGTVRVWRADGLALLRATIAARELHAVRLASLPARIVPTPRHGLGAFRGTVEGPSGTVETVTVLAGYTYSIACAALNGKRSLSFAVENPLGLYPNGQPVRFRVAVGSSGPTVSGIIEPGRPTWVYHYLRLPKVNGCVSITFAATAPTGSAIATWATFAAPGVI